MPVELRWIANRSVSCLHALDAVMAGRLLVLEHIAAVLKGPSERIAAMCEAANIASDRLFDHLIPLSLGIETTANLTPVALMKAAGPEVTAKFAGQLASLITEAKVAYAAECPRFIDELALRAGPLREHWETRGPGILAGIQRQLQPDVLVAAADVMLVQPVQGGGGAEHPPYNSVRIETVLTNPDAELPETVRIAWLIAQLNFDLPKYSDGLRSVTSPRIIRLALLPSTLAAAEDVELVRDPEAMLPRAIELWGLGDSAMAAPVAEWWKTYCATKPPLPVALSALQQMVDA